MSALRSSARRAGVIYLVMSLVGAPALLFLPRFIVPGDAAATAQRIADGAPVYRLLMLGDLAGSILFVVLGWSLYQLFETVNRPQALLMLLLVLVSATLGMVDVALLSPPLVFSAYPGSLSAFAPAQLDALTLGLLRIRSMELRTNEMLWGLWLVPFGLLVIRSGFIPKVIGWLLLLACAGYVAMSTAYVGFPAYSAAADRVGNWLIQGELVVIFWLLIKGARSDVPTLDAGPATA